MATTTVRTTPRMTFTALCEYLQASPTRRRSLVKEQKYPGPQIGSYAEARRRAITFAVHGTPLDPTGMDPHEEQAVQLLAANGWSVPAPTTAHPNPHQAAMTIEGVAVSAFPDVLLQATTRGATRVGALKFYFPNRDLDQQVGRWMASFLFQYLQTVAGVTDAHPDLCVVYDVRQDVSHYASRSFATLFRNVEHACREIAAVWPAV